MINSQPSPNEVSMDKQQDTTPPIGDEPNGDPAVSDTAITGTSGFSPSIHENELEAGGESTDISSNIQQLEQKFDLLTKSFDSKLKYDESKQKIIDSLHKELQVYRDGFHFKILQPLFVDLIDMYGDLSKLLKNLPPSDLVTQKEQQLHKNLGSFQGSIEDILLRYDVALFNEAGADYVPSRQRVVGYIQTDNPDLDKQIAERIRPGFAYDGRTLRPEFVKLYRYQLTIERI